MDKELRLTSFSSSGGWAGKASIEVLDRVLGQINNIKSSEKILIDHKYRDDAAVYKFSDDKALIFTTDFFSPMVDDPYIFGQIASVNAISDIYAMGGKPFLALNISCFSEILPNGFIEKILEGGINKANEANVIIAGGHTINDDEPKYGLAVIGEVHPDKIMTVSKAEEDQDIIVTKPIGNGIISTALKNNLVDEKYSNKATKYMLELNKSASESAQKFNIKTCTDITGYGLIGHLKNILNASNVSAEIIIEEIPILDGVSELSKEENWCTGLRNNLEKLDNEIIWGHTQKIPDEKKMIMFDPQTSGGLIFCCDKEISNKFIAELSKNENLFVKKIGRTIKKSNFQIKFL